jgi:hypothetical protein
MLLGGRICRYSSPRAERDSEHNSDYRPANATYCTKNSAGQQSTIETLLARALRVQRASDATSRTTKPCADQRHSDKRILNGKRTYGANEIEVVTTRID